LTVYSIVKIPPLVWIGHQPQLNGDFLFFPDFQQRLLVNIPIPIDTDLVYSSI